MPTKKEQFIEERKKHATSINMLVALAERTEEQEKEFDNATKEFDRLTKEIERQTDAERINALLDAPQPRVVKPEPVVAAMPSSKTSIFSPSGRTREDKLDAFFAALPWGDRQRVAAAGGDIFQEAQAGDGGYLLPVDKRDLISLLAPPEMVHSRCDMIYTPSNSTTVPVDEDADWSTSLAAEDVSEGAALTEQKAAFKSLDVTLAKKGVLVRVTREMLEDNTGIAQYVTTKLARKLAWKLHALCIAAYKGAASRITVAKTSGAAAGSAPDFDNVQKMFTSMLVQHRDNAVWLANPQLESTFQSYYIEGSAGGVFPVYLPAGGLADAPYARLKGRPVLYVEGLPAVGTEGDLMLVDPSTFYLALKSVGPRIDESIHAEFKNDVIQYRGYLRAACVSKFSGKITRPDSTEAANVVTLGTRA